MKSYIAYTRVSTSTQNLGLEAQTASIESYIKANNGVLVESFSEKESGKETANRPALQAAINRCKTEGHTLIVAKLDRLSRDVMTIFSLKKDTRLHFECVNIDASDTMTLGIFATLGQKERELISLRTSEALAAKKADGVKLGNPNAAETLRKYNHLGVEARKRKANENEASRKAFAAIRYMDGTLREKAEYLNENGFATVTGKKFTAMQIKRLIERYS